MSIGNRRDNIPNHDDGREGIIIGNVGTLRDNYPQLFDPESGEPTDPAQFNSIIERSKYLNDILDKFLGDTDRTSYMINTLNAEGYNIFENVSHPISFQEALALVRLELADTSQDQFRFRAVGTGLLSELRVSDMGEFWYEGVALPGSSFGLRRYLGILRSQYSADFPQDRGIDEPIQSEEGISNQGFTFQMWSDLKGWGVRQETHTIADLSSFIPLVDFSKR